MVLPREALARVAGAFQTDPCVRAVWIGGSVRDGVDDEVSDLDLWIESDSWTPERAKGLLVAGTHANFDGIPLLHGVDDHGVIVDLRYGNEVPPEYRKLACFPAVEISDAGMDPTGFWTDFWINSYKHRKPIWRGLDSLVLFGLQFDRMALVRAWVVESTGDASAEPSFSIHGLTSVVRDHITSQRMAILGLPTRNRTELLETISAYRSEMLRLSPPGLQLPAIVMSDPLFAQMRR